MKQIHNLYKLLILFCATFLAQNAVAQVEGDKYHSLGEEKISGVSVIDASSEGGGAPMENAADGNDGTMWKSTTKSSSDRYPWIILDVGEIIEIFLVYHFMLKMLNVLLLLYLFSMLQVQIHVIGQQKQQ